jgi:hypothetical protein
MGTQLDIVGSFVIAGLLLLAIFGTSASLTATATQNALDILAQENLSVVTEMILYDFHKIGYYPSHEPPDDFRILSMSPNGLRFRSDIDNDGSIDTVSYSVGDTSEVSGTPNRKDFILYRLVGNEPRLGAALGVTDFHLLYRDADDNVTVVPKDVRSIEVGLAVESPYAQDDLYPRAVWHTVVRPRNLALQ